MVMQRIEKAEFSSFENPIETLAKSIPSYLAKKIIKGEISRDRISELLVKAQTGDLGNDPELQKDIEGGESGDLEGSLAKAKKGSPGYDKWLEKFKAAKNLKVYNKKSHESSLKSPDKGTRAQAVSSSLSKVNHLKDAANDKSSIVRHAVASHKDTPNDILHKLTLDKRDYVAKAAIQSLKNRGVSSKDISKEQSKTFTYKDVDKLRKLTNKYHIGIIPQDAKYVSFHPDDPTPTFHSSKEDLKENRSADSKSADISKHVGKIYAIGDEFEGVPLEHVHIYDSPEHFKQDVDPEDKEFNPSTSKDVPLK